MTLNKHLATACLVLAGIFATAEGEKLTLHLESKAKSIRLGESTQLKLRLAGTDIDTITSGFAKREGALNTKSEFVHSSTFRPEKQGAHTFGPFSMSINGTKVNSNTVTIQVLPEWNGEFGTFFRVHASEIELGDEIELVVETWSEGQSSPSLSLKWDKAYSQRIGGTAFRTNSDNGKMTRMASKRYFITPKEAGTFTISEELFQKVPDGIAVPRINVTVSEPVVEKPPRP